MLLSRLNDKEASVVGEAGHLLDDLHLTDHQTNQWYSRENSATGK